MKNKTTLYRAYNKDNELIYVGISSAVFNRFDQHLHTSKWIDECSYIQLEHFKTRNDAMNAEKRAIKIENPLYNVVHKEGEK